MKLAPKLTIYFLLLSILPTAVVGYLAYENGKRTIIQKTNDYLVSINIFKSNELKRWISGNGNSIEQLAERPLVRQYAAVVTMHNTADPAYREAKRSVIEEHLKTRLKYGGFLELFVISPYHGLVSASTDEKQEGKYRDTFPYYIEGKSRTYVQGVYYSAELEQPAITVSTPIRDKQGNLLGVLAGRLDLGQLSKIISLKTGESPTEDTYLVNTFNFFVTEPRFGQGYALKKAVHTEGVEAGLSGKDGAGFYNDYRGVPVIGAYKWLPEFNMCIITEIGQTEAFAPVARLAWVISGIASAICFAAGLMGLFFARTITRPVKRLAAGTEKVGAGNLEHRVGTASKDEIGGLSRSFDRMTENLKTITVSRDDLIKEIEKRKLAEDEILRLNESLEQKVQERTAQLEAANKEMEAFTYSVSHDLRAPLRAVDGYTRILAEDYAAHLNEDAQGICGYIRDGAQRMAKLIDDLLAFSRLSRAEMRSSSIDMHGLANSVFFELAPPDRRNSVDFRLHALPRAEGDPTMVRQIWVNLISNALKFTSKRERAVIDVGSQEGAHETIYSIRDDGAGFDMQYVHNLFGVFQRLHSTREFEGTGVGLAIVRRIVHRHGGRTWAEGETDKGATIYFTLPVK